ncbi:MAG: hypothetical protein JSV88_10605 [Candidatus Aminicenantes bacterium]|nr:MAG: hypothetical protein JSV88_10605 [Candidatus Aminicenantes bacterium]
MRLKLNVALIFFVLLAYHCSTGDVTPTSPENLLKALSNAVNSNDKAKAETFFTKECWNARNYPGEQFFTQAVKKKFEMKTTNTRIKGKKAVVTADILREGKKVDRVYFYAVDVNGLWKFDGMDENRNHVEHYLNDRLPARFILSHYPGSQELQELGTKLIGIAASLQEEAKDDPGKQKSLLEGILIGDPGRIYSELRLLLKVSNMNLKVMSTHMVDSIQRGAIVIHDETGKEKIFIYAAKEPGGWKLINCTTGWLSEESILK